MLGVELSSVSILVLAVSCFGTGVLASLSPCVYPVIPLVIAYIGTNAKTWRQSFYYALGFTLGLSVVYTSLGLLASIAGVFLGKWTGNPYLQFFMAGICFIGAFHYWGLIKLPSVTVSYNRVENRLTMLGSILLGAGSGLMATACTTPIVLTLLSYIATHRIGPALGAGLLFLFSLGMATVYLIVAILVGMIRSVPRAGKWMEVIYEIFPWMLFCLGIYFVFKAGRLW